MASFSDNDDGVAKFDLSSPLKGLVICCTSIPPEQRTEIAAKVQELGGTHTYDLTPDCTHLLVGDYATPKYRHVAHERCDIKAMDALWIETLMELWKDAESFDPNQLEKKFELLPLETSGVEPASQGGKAARGSLLICLTGFGEQRTEIENTILENGGRYKGDLTKECTHLIVHKPEGKKFVAAKQWGVKTVVLDWLAQSVERGMILDEDKFDPILPPEQIGVDAWVKRDSRQLSLGKRSRSAVSAPEDGSRKLRKTASMKINSQSSGLWGDILGRSSTKSDGRKFKEDDDLTRPKKPLLPSESKGIFANCTFAIHGFPDSKSQILRQTISVLGGSITSTLQALLELNSGSEPTHRILIVPQTSQPETHPQVDDNIALVTEFYIEKCLHNKKYFCPDEHVIGRPFPLFPIHGFSDLTICTAAFSGVELNHISRSITQLGAKYEERFHKETSLLVVQSFDAVRKEKMSHAIKWGVPIVSAEWLWDCISTGYNVPLDDFVLPKANGKKSAVSAKPPSAKSRGQAGFRHAIQRTESAPPRQSGGKIDASAFDKTPQKRSNSTVTHKEAFLGSFDAFVTAKTCLSEPERPLSELSSAGINKSPSPAKQPASARRRTKSDIIAGRTRVSKSYSALSETAAASETAGSGSRRQSTAEEQASLKARALEKAQLGLKLSSLIGQPPAASSVSSAHVSRPRKRQVLGRAFSNVSSGTNDDSSRPARALTTTSVEEVILGGDLAAGEQQKTDEPRGTQLEYCDPAAVLAKKKVMELMTGVRSHASEEKAPTRVSAEVDESDVIGALGNRVLRKR